MIRINNIKISSCHPLAAEQQRAEWREEKHSRRRLNEGDVVSINKYNRTYVAF